MKNILMFEKYNENIELKNLLTNHLSQYPFISYTLDDSDGLVIIFNKDVNVKYGTGILNMFDYKILNKNPLKLKILKMKEIKNDEYKGKTILQNIEKVSFPDFKIYDIEVKLDSGASSSVFHCSKIKNDRQTRKVSFIPLDDSYDQFKNKVITKPLYSEISVQNSSGSQESRPMIKTDIVIKGKTYEIFISLADRKELDYPALLGKDILVNFLIQPGI